VLNNLKDPLGSRKSSFQKKESNGTFEVCIQKEIEVVIAIFSEYNLNTSKHLKKAFLLYTNGTSCKRNNKLKMEINNIRKGMNLTRTDFTLPQNHVFNVTPD